MPAHGLALFISQSGETADTIAAQRYAKAAGSHVAVLVNTADSSMAREADAVLMTQAGPEIGVASTKAFTTQLTVLACFTIALAKARGTIDRASEAKLCQAIAEVPAQVAILRGQGGKRLRHSFGIDFHRVLLPCILPERSRNNYFDCHGLSLKRPSAFSGQRSAFSFQPQLSINRQATVSNPPFDQMLRSLRRAQAMRSIAFAAAPQPA